MKIWISKYRNHWLSPYIILEKIHFWKELDYDAKWVNTVVDILNPVCERLQKVLDFIHPRINYVKIDKYDTWSLDSTLALIIVPMLKQLRASKHGIPMAFCFDEQENELPFEDSEAAWDAALEKMIWSFEQSLLDYHEEPNFFVNNVYDREAADAYKKRVDEGRILFSIHYDSLWD